MAKNRFNGGGHARAFWLFALLTAIAVFLLCAGVFLASPAGEPRRADAIVILGGDSGPRAVKGLELYRGDYAPVVLLTVLEEGPFTHRYAADPRSRALMAGGVRKEVIEFVGESKNSWQEAENTLRLAKPRGWRTVIVVSDPPHMRRLSWAWGRVLKGSGVTPVLVASEPSWWHAWKWWLDKDSARFVLTEYVKLLYYFWKY